MAWLNLHTELTARLQRRRRAEERVRRGGHEARLFRAATVVLVLGCGGLVWLAAHVPDTGGAVHMPQRSEGDAGPLGNIGLAPAAGPAPPSTAVPASAPAPAPSTPSASRSTVPTTSATVASTTSTTDPVTTAPGNGNGNGNGNPPDHTTPTRPTSNSSPPTSHAGG